jgi:hypothetical protein
MEREGVDKRQADVGSKRFGNIPPGGMRNLSADGYF